MHCYFALQSLSILFHYLIQPISLMFCGHLGKTQLASAAMAISVRFHDVRCTVFVLFAIGVKVSFLATTSVVEVVRSAFLQSSVFF